MPKEKSEKFLKLEKMNEDIVQCNQQMNTVQHTITSLKADSDQLSFDAEKENSASAYKMAFTKVNALKRAAMDNEKELEVVSAKKSLVRQESGYVKQFVLFKSRTP